MRALITPLAIVAIAGWAGCAARSAAAPAPTEETTRPQMSVRSTARQTASAAAAQPQTQTQAARVERELLGAQGEQAWAAADRFDSCSSECTDGSVDDRATCRLNCVGFAMAAVDKPPNDAVPCVQPCLDQVNACHFACGERPRGERQTCRDSCEDDRTRCVIACAR